MELEGSFLLPAPPDAVWLALNDPEALARAIPGCEKLEKTGENGFSAVVRLRLGALDARFSGQVELSELDPPRSYVLSGQGQGGMAGFVKGRARVELSPEAGGTRLSYRAKADPGGKLAALGGRLLSGVAAKMAEEFFSRLALPAPTAVEEATDRPKPYWLWGGLALWLFILWTVFLSR